MPNQPGDKWLNVSDMKRECGNMRGCSGCKYAKICDVIGIRYAIDFPREWDFRRLKSLKDKKTYE